MGVGVGVGSRLETFDRGGFQSASWSTMTRETVLSVPRDVVLGSSLPMFERAVDALATHRAGIGQASLRDDLSGLETGREAIALAGLQVNQVTLLRLMTATAIDDRPPPRDLREPFQYLDTLRQALRTVRTGGEKAFDAALLFGISQRLGGRGLGGRELVRSQQAADTLDRLLHDTSHLPLLVRASLLTAHIELMTPFGVVSGILGRLCLPLLLASAGRPAVFLSNSLLAHRLEHERALADLGASGQWEGWIGFYLGQVADAAEHAQVRLNEAVRLRQALASELNALRSHSNAHQLAELAVTMPVMTVGMAQTALSVSFQTANAAIAALVKLGVLQPQTSVRRNRIFTLGVLAAPAAC